MVVVEVVRQGVFTSASVRDLHWSRCGAVHVVPMRPGADCNQTTARGMNDFGKLWSGLNELVSTP